MVWGSSEMVDDGSSFSSDATSVASTEDSDSSESEAACPAWGCVECDVNRSHMCGLKFATPTNTALRASLPAKRGTQEQPDSSPVSTMQGLVEKMIAGPRGGEDRVKFQVVCSTGEAVWVPQGTGVTFLGLAAGGISSVVYFPWLSAALAQEHLQENQRCGQSIARVALSTIKACAGEPMHAAIAKADKFFMGTGDKDGDPM